MATEKQKVWNILKDVKSKKPIYQDTVEFRISGIPCLLGIQHFNQVQGSHSYNAASDVDYYGYTECDFDVLDRKGYRAKWLEAKMTDRDWQLAEDAIADYYRAEDYYD